MHNYYLITPKESRDCSFAMAPESERGKLYDELLDDLTGVSELPYQFNLMRLSVGKKGLIRSEDLSGVPEIWLDILPNSFAWPLYSEGLKAIIEKHLTGREVIEWIKAPINGPAEQRFYYIPVFQKKLDVLDTQKTKYLMGSESVLIPCFSYSKVKNYSLFHIPTSGLLWKIRNGYISESLKKAIQKENLQGIHFEKSVVE